MQISFISNVELTQDVSPSITSPQFPVCDAYWAVMGSKLAMISSALRVRPGVKGCNGLSAVRISHVGFAP